MRSLIINDLKNVTSKSFHLYLFIFLLPLPSFFYLFFHINFYFIPPFFTYFTYSFFISLMILYYITVSLSHCNHYRILLFSLLPFFLLSSYYNFLFLHFFSFFPFLPLIFLFFLLFLLLFSILFQTTFLIYLYYIITYNNVEK